MASRDARSRRTTLLWRDRALEIAAMALACGVDSVLVEVPPEDRDEVRDRAVLWLRKAEQFRR